MVWGRRPRRPQTILLHPERLAPYRQGRMIQLLIRRLLSSIVALLVLAVAIFSLLRAAPGNFAHSALSAEPKITEEMIKEVEHQYGLDAPIPVQLGRFANELIRGDLGRSFYFRTQVSSIIRSRIAISFELMIGALALAVPLGVTLGVISATNRNTPIDYAARVTAIAGICTPQFVLGIVILFVLLRFFDYSPPFSYASLFEEPSVNLQQFLWPVLILALGPMAAISRLTRSQMLEVLREDYVRTATAKGLTNRAVIMRHALRNALPPVIALIASTVGALIGGAVVVERLFSLPGIGMALISGVAYHDYPLVQGIVLLVGTSFIVVSLTLDVVVGWLDPRIRDAAQ
ncbi:MAG: ABC transporter permease [Chloroflexota bacterium]